MTDSNNITLLKNTNNAISTIYHLADIHISKNIDRHEEYKSVFKNLVSNISKQKTKSASNNINNAVIVICGDLVNENSRLAPNQINLVKELLINLAKMHDIIIILGNHDMNMNEQNTNSIGPIIEKLETQHKIFLLNENKNYLYENIVFGVTTVGSNIVTEPFEMDNTINVGLYHGTLNGCTLDNGFALSNNKMFTIKDFKGYDIVCLGDIHKFQFLDKKQRICYASSLIQQNISEDPENHGYVKWNLETKKAELIKIKNDHKMVKIVMNDSNVNEIIKNINNIASTTSKCYVYYSDITHDKAKQCCDELKKKMPKINCILHCEKSTSTVDCKIGKNVKIKDINNDATLEQIVKEHMNDAIIKMSSEEKSICDNLLKNVIEASNNNYNATIKNIEIEYLEFDNYYLYGKGNSIKYSNLQGIIGLDSPAHTGKSTSIDCLLYAIYGVCSRGTFSTIINLKYDLLKTTVGLKVNGTKYEITRKRRIVKRKKTIRKIETNEIVVIKKNNDVIT
jgi:DNA repair exonuclease SbcCD nuclease subunit